MSSTWPRVKTRRRVQTYMIQKYLDGFFQHLSWCQTLDNAKRKENLNITAKLDRICVKKSSTINLTYKIVHYLCLISKGSQAHLIWHSTGVLSQITDNVTDGACSTNHLLLGGLHPRKVFSVIVLDNVGCVNFKWTLLSLPFNMEIG